MRKAGGGQAPIHEGAFDVERSGSFPVRKLKIPGNNTGNGYIFIKMLPAKSKSVETDRHFLELFIACCCQYPESVRWKTYYATVGQLDIDCSLFHPGPYGGRLNRLPFSN